MNFQFLITLSVLYTVVLADPLSDYVDMPEDSFGWVDTGITFPTLLGGVARVVNVTTLQWWNQTIMTLPYNNKYWSHQVVVITPKIVEFRNTALAYLTGSCNDKTAPTDSMDEEIEMVDKIAFNTKTVSIVVY